MRLSYHDARNRVLEEILAERPDVFIIGGDFSGPFEEPNRLREIFGADRVQPAPISETAFTGVAVGAAMAGLHPIVDFGTASFIFNAWEMVVNEAANHHYMSGGRVRVPVVFHILAGARGAGASQHSHAPQAMLMNTPGLKIFCPATPADVMGLMRTAVSDPNPCVFVDHIRLFPIEGEVPGTTDAMPFGQARICRTGSDVTIVASSFLLHRALAAAETLTQHGIGAEVIDLRTLVPLDEQTILASVRKTGRLVVVDETHLTGGVASEIAARVAEKAFASLRAPIVRLGTLDAPIPYSPHLEPLLIPDARRIAEAAQAVLRGTPQEEGHEGRSARRGGNRA